MAAAVALGTTVIDLVDAVAASRPKRLAVHSSDGTLTYAELLERADAVAAELGELGVQPGDLVGLCVARSSALVAGALGVLRAGAAYVAIDPSYPDDRIAWMVEDSGAKTVVCDEGTKDRLGDRRPTLVLGRGGRCGRLGRPDRLPVHPAPSDPA